MQESKDLLWAGGGVVYSGHKIPIEAPFTKVQGIFNARKMSVYCSSLANPRSKSRGMRSLSIFN
jgi:hypothetical protein